MGRVTRFGSKLVAALLLCSSVLLGSQMLLPSLLRHQHPAGATIMVNQPAHQQVISVARSSQSFDSASEYARPRFARIPSYVVAELRAVVHTNHCFFPVRLLQALFPLQPRFASSTRNHRTSFVSASEESARWGTVNSFFQITLGGDGCGRYEHLLVFFFSVGLSVGQDTRQDMDMSAQTSRIKRHTTWRT